MKSKKLQALLLSIVMMLSLAVPTLAAEENAAAIPADLNGKLVILHTNDTHGADLEGEGSIGTAGVAQLKQDYESAGAEVLLLSAGDAIQGTSLVNLDTGKSAIQFMNAAGYDAMVPGNHEFDWGYENLKTIAADAEFPMLAANILDTATGKPVFQANKIFELKSGTKVGVFGLGTPETMTKAHPDKVKGIRFLAGEELFACAQAQVDELKKAGCNVIVALGHLGIDTESTGNRSIDLLEQVSGINLFIDGHSHSTTEEISAVAGSNPINGTYIVSTGTKLAQVSVAVYDQGALQVYAVRADDATATDPEVAKLIAERNEVVTKELAKVFAKTEVELTGVKAIVRSGETNLGDFAADAILWSARQALGEDQVDVAMTNGGGIRASIAAGDITMNDMKTVFPFGNEVTTITVTGAQLLEALEAATFCIPEPIGAFPQVAGMSFSIDTAALYEKGNQYPDSTYFAPSAAGTRIKDLKIGGEAVVGTKTYVVATNDFTAAGGDTYGVFKQLAATKTGVAMEDALVDYTAKVLGGVITAEQYGQTAGRITLNYVGVEPGAWYTAAAKLAVDSGAIQSTQNGFEPYATVTCATVFQTLYNLDGQPKVRATVTDVADMWYADCVNWAASIGLMEGTSFGADFVVTRGQIAKILADYCITKDYAVQGGMAIREVPDYDEIPAEVLAGVGYCYHAGIMTGDQNGRLNPMGELTRAEFAQMLKNLEIFTTTWGEAKAA